MTMVNHQNIANEQNQVYCCLRNKLVQADMDHKTQFCAGCQMYQGNAGGVGIECRWEDLRTDAPQLVIQDAVAEWIYNQKKLVAPFVAAAADPELDALGPEPSLS